MSSLPKIEIARIYDDASRTDEAVRVLVDRLWPRGVSRERAMIDYWPKDATPTSALRQAWHADQRGHEPSHFAAFKSSYLAELQEEPARTAIQQLAAAVSGAPQILLITAVKHPDMSHVPVFADELTAALKAERS